MEKKIAETFQQTPHFSKEEEKHDIQNNGKTSNYRFNPEKQSICVKFKCALN
jgi:hypothetical protein